MSELLELCEIAVKEALKNGADEAEAYATKGDVNEVLIERNDLKIGKGHQQLGIGVRVFSGFKLGYSSTNSLNKDDVLTTSTDAVRISRVGIPDRYNSLPSPSIVQNVSGIYDSEAEAFTLNDVFKFAFSLLDTARKYDQRVTVDSGGFTGSVIEEALVNSNGMVRTEKASIFTWVIMGMAVDGDEVSSFDYQFNGTHFVKDIRVEEEGLELARNVVNSLKARKCESFKGHLLLTPEAVRDLLIQGIVHSANANNVQKGYSRFIGKIGERVASELLTIIDDGTFSEGLAASSFDREGVGRRPLTIIERGVLKSFLHNTYTALKDGTRSTGHAAGGIRTSPSVGPSNIIVEQGPKSVDELVEEVQKGVYVTKFSGFPSSVSGDFSGVVKGGYLIEKGKTSQPVKETLVTGNMYDMLKNVSGVSKERKKAFNFVLPYMRVEDVSITAG